MVIDYQKTDKDLLYNNSSFALIDLFLGSEQIGWRRSFSSADKTKFRFAMTADTCASGTIRTVIIGNSVTS